MYRTSDLALGSRGVSNCFVLNFLEYLIPNNVQERLLLRQAERNFWASPTLTKIRSKR
jgi:hypothetical protein